MSRLYAHGTKSSESHYRDILMVKHDICNAYSTQYHCGRPAGYNTCLLQIRTVFQKRIPPGPDCLLKLIAAFKAPSHSSETSQKTSTLLPDSSVFRSLSAVLPDALHAVFLHRSKVTHHHLEGNTGK